MAKLPPPYIEESISAQCGREIEIPFQVNRAVSINMVSKMALRIKTIATNKIICNIESDFDKFGTQPYNSIYKAEFTLPNDVQLVPGQFYKAQIAFYDGATLGHYSSVGVFKYTNKPTIEISGLSTGEIGNLYTYTGIYENDDTTEKVYSYRFYVEENKTHTIIADSGILLHNSSLDTQSNASYDTWVLSEELDKNTIYTIRYEVTTVNGYTDAFIADIVNNELMDTSLSNCTILTEADFNNGRIFVKISSPSVITGRGGFVVSRADSKDNFKSWRNVRVFTLTGNAVLPEELWVDYTVEQGVSYIYGLQRFNSAGFYGTRLMSQEPILADFEDIFLYDGQRQLKVRFNPKISSLKNTVLETKVDTIGGQYPFIFRNGNICYKEFPISGLISYLSDPDELFMSNIKLGLANDNLRHRHSTAADVAYLNPTNSNCLDAINIAAERNFKLEVLKWLTNGEIKLFRSPTEGNYIIRLMNTSLSPNDTLGRMIHTFSSTAYEVADCNFENLIKYKFIKDTTIDDIILMVSSVNLDGIENGTNIIADYHRNVSSATFVNVPSGTVFSLQFLNNTGPIDIVIPSNGHYKINVFDEPLTSIRLKSLAPGRFKLSGLLDVCYYAEYDVGDFSPIRKVIIRNELLDIIGTSTDSEKDNIIDEQSDIKYQFEHFYEMTIETRDIVPVYQRNGKYYTHQSQDDSLLEQFHSKRIYEIQNSTTAAKYFTGDNPTGDLLETLNYDIEIAIGDEEIKTISIGTYSYGGIDNLTTKTGLYTLPELDNITHLTVGNGLFLTSMCRRKEYIYGVEEDRSEVKAAKKAWKDNPSDATYNDFINALETALSINLEEEE